MTDLEVRRPKFDFTDDVPWNWNPGNPVFSFWMNAVSMLAIGFEQMIVAAVRDAEPLIVDPEVKAEAVLFLRQEATHSSAHRKHVGALIEKYPGLRQTLDAACASFADLTADRSLRFRLAYIADLEATFTPSFKLMLDNEATLFRPGDDRVASLLLWHFVEEVEHRSSAIVIYNAVVGDSGYRMRALPSVLGHLTSVMTILADGVDAHVPARDRAVDARGLLAATRIRAALRPRDPFGDKRPSPPSPFASVPRKERLVAAWRLLLSQLPHHDPAHEPLPRFADLWFRRWDRGGDVTRWYTAEAIS